MLAAAGECPLVVFMKPGKEVEKVGDLLRTAYAKLLMARRFRENRRLRSQLSFMAAFSAAPVLLPDSFSNLYLASAASDVKKALKKVRRIRRTADTPSLASLEKLLSDMLERRVFSLQDLVLAQKLCDDASAELSLLQ